MHVLKIAAACAATGALALAVPGSASAACPRPDSVDDLNCFVPPLSGTFTHSVSLAEYKQTNTGVPGDPGGSGTSNITLNADTNTVCATTSWTGIDSPVVMAHIHGGRAGQPENPAVTISLFEPDMINGRSSPASGCTLVPPGMISAIEYCVEDYNVVVHSQQHPVGAIRGQLGNGCIVNRPQ